MEGKMKENAKRVLYLIGVLFVLLTLVGCDLRPSTTTFIPLPPPVSGNYPLTLNYSSLGLASQQMNLVSPKVSVQYVQNASGIAGSIASELITLYPSAKRAVMLEADWGDWLKGRVKLTEFYSSKGELVGGMVLLDVKEASILHLVTGVRYVIDRSYLYLVYVSPAVGQIPVFDRAMYTEEWGTGQADKWAMGVTSTWKQSAKPLFGDFSRWGFWESKSSPFFQVTSALELARTSLVTVPADFLAVDKDSARELIGRQSGFELYRSGQLYGKINFTYKGLWGRAPNTKSVGSGSLSRIDWNLSDGNYYMLALSSNLSPVPATLYVFTNDENVANQIEVSDWTTNYERLRAGMPGVLLAVYSLGDLGSIVKTSTDSEGKSSEVKIGDAGGIYYSVLGKGEYEQVVKCVSLLNMMGKSGIKVLGLHYPSTPGSGSGLYYYLNIVSIVSYQGQDVLDKWGVDVGVLDRVGFAE